MQANQWHTLQGIVVRKTAFGESAWILGVFTKECGKISVFAPYARKSTKRFGPYIDLFAEVQWVVKKPHEKNLWRLQETQLIEANSQLRQDLFPMATMTYFVECLWHLLAQEDPHEHLYTYLQHYLQTLPQGNATWEELFEAERTLLHHCGFEPDFYQCVHCGTSIDRRAFFSYQQSGMLCHTCKQPGQGRMISQAAILALGHQAPWSPLIYKELREVLGEFVGYLVGRPLKSQAFRQDILPSITPQKAPLYG
jgi:DNA repair protein RecO